MTVETSRRGTLYSHIIVKITDIELISTYSTVITQQDRTMCNLNCYGKLNIYHKKKSVKPWVVRSTLKYLYIMSQNRVVISQMLQPSHKRMSEYKAMKKSANIYITSVSKLFKAICCPAQGLYPGDLRSTETQNANLNVRMHISGNMWITLAHI